jgi:hypothetical protein
MRCERFVSQPVLRQAYGRVTFQLDNNTRDNRFEKFRVTALAHRGPD